MKFGKELRGKSLADYLLVETQDGYRVIFALPELDSSFGESTNICSQISRDGKPLEGSDGRLRPIIPNENRYARWVRQGRQVVDLPRANLAGHATFMTRKISDPAVAVSPAGR